jgi:uncharacterized protein (UPF0332 family)
VSAETEALLAKARRSLANARRSLEAGDADFAASRAYYAMFYAAEALLLSRGLAFSKHGAVIAEFSREFVRSGEFPAEYGRALREAWRRGSLPTTTSGWSSPSRAASSFWPERRRSWPPPRGSSNRPARSFGDFSDSGAATIDARRRMT